jgi:A/G-specific adenine glycosylase
LGYYRRAHHLHAAARRVVGEHGGRIPDEAAELRALPGVGRYTAGAVASIAFGRREPVLDGNVARVLSRVFYGSDALDRRNGEAAGSAPNGTPKGREQARTAALWALAESLLPARRPGDFNQALMELGAQVCLPASPKCSACPIARRCAARACGAQHKALIATKRAARATMHVAALVVRRRGCVLLVRRPDGGLWSGLWELPCAVTDGGAVGEPQLRGMVDSMGMSGGAIEALGEVTRVLTHRIYRVKAFILHDPRGRIPRSGHYRWCDPDKPEVGIAGPSRRVLALLSTKLLRLPRKKG